MENTLEIKDPEDVQEAHRENDRMLKQKAKQCPYCQKESMLGTACVDCLNEKYYKK